MKNRKRVLFVHYGDNWIRGSEQCLLDLVTHLNRAQYTPYVWTNCEALHHRMQNDAMHSEYSPFTLLLGWKAPRFSVLGWYRLVKQGIDYIKRAQIDIIHVNSGAPCQWMSLAARITKTPMVTQLHSDYPMRDRLTLGLHFSPHIIAVSKAITEHLRRDGYKRDRLSVIHNGIDVDRLKHFSAVDLNEKLGIADDAYVFITVGSLIHRKGIDRILSAIRHLALEYPNTHLLVIGEGPQRHSLELNADELHINNHVHFVGEQTNVQGWLHASNAFVSGARNEAFGLVIIEAALAELPIVAPRVGGIPEIIRHKQTGLLYENSSIKPLVEAMRAVMKHPYPARALGVRAKQNVLARHTIQHNARAIEFVYEQLLEAQNLPEFSWLAAFRPVKTYITKHFA
ncbi:glycosyl transferase [Vibrio alginolyticus]|nr:glycosyl transferase [Vibrio alginolyticus]